MPMRYRKPTMYKKPITMQRSVSKLQEYILAQHNEIQCLREELEKVKAILEMKCETPTEREDPREPSSEVPENLNIRIKEEIPGFYEENY